MQHNYDSLIPHARLVLSGHVSVISFQVFINLFSLSLATDIVCEPSQRELAL